MTQLTFTEDHRHVLLAAFPAWGHAKPMCALASRIVRARPVTVTLLSPGTIYPKMVKELASQFGEHETDYHGRIRLVAIANHEQNPFDLDLLNASFVKAYVDLVEERPLTCIKSETEHAALPKPDIAIVDMFANVMMHNVRKHSEQPIKVYGWVSCGAASMSHFWGPTSPNKDRNMHERVEDEAERTGKSVADVAAELLFPAEGEVLSSPGVPPMFDYEHFPQEMMLPQTIAIPFHLAAADVLNKADGILIATPHAFEDREALDYIKNWFEAGSQEVLFIGPMLNTQPPVISGSDKTADFDTFMDRVLKAHGPNSMLYISFGSVWWPKDPQIIWIVIDALLERKVPFIFSHGSPFAQIPEEIKAKVEASGVGLLAPWSPQEAILAHPATGWFISHCGYNSTMETISAGVPLICWPYGADQPMNTAHLTQNLDVAYELTEVRSGVHAKKPLYRTGKTPTGTPESIKAELYHILDLAFGEDGKKKRANMEKLRDAVAHAWTEEGKSSQTLSQFLSSL